MMRMSGTFIVAMAKPSRATMPEEKFFTAVSAKSCNSANSMISSNRADI